MLKGYNIGKLYKEKRKKNFLTINVSTKPYSIRYVFTPWQVSLLELISINVSYHLSLIDDIITFPLASYETSSKWPFKFDRGTSWSSTTNL